MDALKRWWPEVVVVIGIIMEFAIKKLTVLEQSNEKTTVVGLLLAVLVALYARHFKRTEPPLPLPPATYNRQGKVS